MQCEVVTRWPAQACEINITSAYFRRGWPGAEISWLLQQSDAVALQKRLGLEVTNPNKIHVGILNRSGRRRRLMHSDLILKNVRCKFPDTIVTEIMFDGLTFRQQAAWIFRQDIVISPHGAQLANIIFARRCTVLLELFPKNYYMPGWFSQLAVNAGAVCFEGYPNLHPVQDMNRSVANIRVNIHGLMHRAQYSSIEVGTDEIIQIISTMLDARLKCHRILNLN